MPEVPTSSPYAPPRARIDDGMLAGYDGTGTFSVGQCVRDAWASVLRNLLPFLGIGAVLVFTAIAFLGLMVVLVTVAPVLTVALAFVFYLFAMPVLAWGLLRFGLSAMDGRARVVELFGIFERFWPRFGKVALLTILITLVSLPGSLPNTLAQSSDNPWLSGAAWAWFLVWTFTVSTRLSLSFYFMVDRELGVIDALRSSWAWTRGNVLRFALLIGVSILLVIAGALAFGVGLIPASLVITQLWPSAFRQIVGRSDPARAASGA
jgi:hypothetical protein